MPQEYLLKKLSDTVRSDRLIHFDDSQNSAKLAMLKKLECSSTSVSSEVINDDPIENYENVGMGSVENIRKRVRPSARKTTSKYVRIDSEYDEEMLSSKSESSQSSEILEKKDEREIPRQAECTLVEQEELRETAVVNAAAVKLNSDSEVVISDKGVVDCELTIQQMMADFVPELKYHP